jgi:DNA-binding LacI/PurR family transcriptional regulator
MTLKDIAKEAGVSISTVSRIINGNSSNAASKEMQDKIWSIARAGGYVPNTSAQALKQKNRENVSLHFRVLWNIFIIKRKMEQWFQGMKTDWSRQSIMLRSCIFRMRR